jgi:hypothetical protein
MINIFANEAQHKIKEKIRLTKLANKVNHVEEKKIKIHKDKPKDYFKIFETEEIAKMEQKYQKFIDTFVLHKTNPNIRIENAIEHSMDENQKYKESIIDDNLNQNNHINAIFDSYSKLSSTPNILVNLINNIKNDNEEIVETKPKEIFFNHYDSVSLEFLNNTKLNEDVLKTLLKKDNGVLNYLFNKDLIINADDLTTFFDNLKNDIEDDYDDDDSDNIINYDKLQKIKLNKNIKKINIVYQYYYKNQQVTGLGDFIRCCYYFLQFCDRYELDLEFHINYHPIKQYLVHYKNKLNLCRRVTENISFIYEPNAIYYYEDNMISYEYFNIDNKMKKKLNKIINYNGELFIYAINHPKERKINETHKEKIRNLLKPTNSLIAEIQNIMNSINLIKNNFIVLQIRVEDDYQMDNTTRIKYMMDTIRMIRSKMSYDIFLISNDNAIKSLIIKEMPNSNIKTFFNKIGHVGDQTTDVEKIKNTLIDFYLMSVAKIIHSITCYQHGSGFSKWCSVTYNIPYVCYLLPSN